MVNPLPVVLLAFALVAAQIHPAGATVSLQQRTPASILEPTDSLIERRDIPLIRQPQSEILPATRSADEEEEDGAKDPDPSHIPTPPHGKKKNGHHCTQSVCMTRCLMTARF